MKLILIFLLQICFSRLYLLKGGLIYTPKYFGKGDILFGGNKIISISKNIQISDPQLVQVYNVDNQVILPGFIDVHSHVTGGGGEKGPKSRCPEAKLSELINGGITTLVGVLGTDSNSRSLENLYTKCKALEEDGLTTFMWTGSYKIPSKTITGNIERDLLLIDKVIGVKGAISDHRSSQPTKNELEKLIAECRVGGMISSKPGKAYFHLGDHKDKLKLLNNILDSTALPISQIYLTHVNRNPDLIEEGKKWVQRGGYIDITSSDAASRVITMYDREKLPLNHITVSSDSYGSNPVFDERGNLIKYSYFKPIELFQEIRKLVVEHRWNWDKSIPFITSHVSEFLGFEKGMLKEGFDADIVILNQNYEIECVFSKGSLLKNSTWVKKSMFEE